MYKKILFDINPIVLINLLIINMFSVSVVFSQEKSKKDPVNIDGVKANYAHQSYGDHKRNKFDLWLAKSENPTPLVIYIHGGGFVGGDKSNYYNKKDLVNFLNNGVSVATINYRFLYMKPFGILSSLNDSKKFLQFVRFNHKKFNIDKNKVGVYGASAGAGTSLWLAFSDEMSEPLSEDPIARESTRISCVGALATQATYDFFQWKNILEAPEYEINLKSMKRISRAFGLNYDKNRNLENEIEIRENLDFLAKMDVSDPPMFVFNNMKGGFPEDNGHREHHPLHAKALKLKADEVGISSVVYAPKIGIVDPDETRLVEFFLKFLDKN